MQKNIEMELKLLISRRNLKKLLAGDLLKQAVRSGSERQRHLVSSYYDTADWALKRHGIAYRVRDKGDGAFEATVKTTRHNAGGLSERLELNVPLTSAEPVLEGFGELGLGYELTELAPDGVVKLFTVDVERTTYLLDFNGAVLELAVDKGRITAGKKHTAIEEMEIEIKEGGLDALLELASRIAATMPVFAEKRSKFARGLALLGQAADEVSSKARITADGNIRQQVLAIILQRGDGLLAVQNGLIKNAALDAADGKYLVKNLHYMDSLISFGSVFAADDRAKQAAELINQWQRALYKLRDIAALEKLWAEISSVSEEDLSQSTLMAKAAEVKDDQLNVLHQLAKAGSLTEAVYVAASWLAGSAWQNEEYLQAESTVRCRLLDWQEELAAVEDDAARLALLDKMLCLGKCVESRQFIKLFKAAKGLRKVIKSDLRRLKLQQTVAELIKMGKSRALSREAGMVTGWLLAGK